MITLRHLDNAAKVMLGTGLIVAYGYIMEAFYAYYSGNFYERFMFMNRMLGPMAWAYWCLIALQHCDPASALDSQGATESG